MDKRTQAMNDASPRETSHFLGLAADRHEMHWPKKPTGCASAMMTANVGYQMEWSVRELERELARSGNPHVLQLNATRRNGDWRNPTSWRLYADGFEVASGSGAYAREFFERADRSFADMCRDAVAAATLPGLSEREYYLLCRARAIASFEPFDAGNHVVGSRQDRVL